MLGNERRGGEESPLFLLRQWKKKERAILYAFQTPSTVSFRSSRDSSSAFSFHKLVRLDSDPMESSIHRGTISISPGSSQRSAFRFPPPSSSPHRWGEGGGLGSFKRSIEPLAPTVCSSRAFLLAFDFRNRFTVISSLLCSRIGWRRVCLVVEGGIEIYRNSFVTPFVSSPHVGRKHCRGALLAIRAPKRES